MTEEEKKKLAEKGVQDEELEDPVEPESLEEPEEYEDDEVIEVDKEEEEEKKIEETSQGAWIPKTSLGKLVKEGKITDLSEILDQGRTILEPEIVDTLLPNLKTDLLLIGQSKGKFGGGQRRVFKQTQKKTQEGNKPRFSTIAVVGNEDGFVGLGFGKAKETVPAREKAIRRAKKNIIKVRRGSGSWQSGHTSPNSIPFKVSAKVGSVRITLIPAPEGTGLVIQEECAKMLRLAGIKDIWSKTQGLTKTRHNLIAACFNALKKLSTIKIKPHHIKSLAIFEGAEKLEGAEKSAEKHKFIENMVIEKENRVLENTVQNE